MSVNDEDVLDWLRPEKQLVRDAVARGIPVLGVCLGGQLIASALGARVYPGAASEIGWFPVHGVPDVAPSFQFPPEILAFHWHGETFDLPAGAVRLAGSAACENQAFQVGRNVIALQFHLETTPDNVEALGRALPGRAGPRALRADRARSARRPRRAVRGDQPRDAGLARLPAGLIALRRG